jgi:hypothetical protein
MICETGKFTAIEQVWMQLSFNGIWIIGSISMFLENPILAVAYFFIFPVLGITYCIVHLWICPRCPHIKEHSACLQVNPSLTKKLIKKNVSGSLKLYEKAGFFIMLYGLFIIPLYWVIKNQYLLIPFVIFGLMHYLAYFFHFCKKCLNTSCPQNMKKG